MHQHGPTPRLVLALALLGPAACDFSPAFEGYLPCGPGCPAGCTCLAGAICVPEDPALDPACCLDGSCAPPPPVCDPGVVCPLGCRCEGSVCLPPDSDPNFDYCAGLSQDLSCMGPTWTVRSLAELRQQLSGFAAEPGPHKIVFDPALGGELVLPEDLPPVTSLIFLDGGEGGFTLRGAGASRGLEVEGTGVILANLRLVGFPHHAVGIRGTSADVHLHNLRLGEPGAPNGSGLSIAPGARGVTLGRGRELTCGTWRSWPFDPEALDRAGWDVNVIVANTGHGIEARGVQELTIEGTWVGFDLMDDLGQGAWHLGNGGAGILLQDVRGAFLGVCHLTANEIGGGDDYRPACVAVGRSGLGGIQVEGGGDIDLRCTLIGDTPTMTPWDENHSFGLEIAGTTGPVHYGPRAEAQGLEALAANLIHTDTAPALVVRNVGAPVVVRGAQLQRVFPQGPAPPYGVRLEGQDSRLELVHLNLLGSFAVAWISAGEGTRLSLKNSLAWWLSGPRTQPVVDARAVPGELEISRSVLFGFDQLCMGSCPAEGDNLSLSDLDALCGFEGPRPTQPGCPLVDCGLELGLDVNGPRAGAHDGCGPDIGAFECTTQACRQAAPCPRPDCL